MAPVLARGRPKPRDWRGKSGAAVTRNNLQEDQIHQRDTDNRDQPVRHAYPHTPFPFLPLHAPCQSLPSLPPSFLCASLHLLSSLPTCPFLSSTPFLLLRHNKFDGFCCNQSLPNITPSHRLLPLVLRWLLCPASSTDLPWEPPCLLTSELASPFSELTLPTLELILLVLEPPLPSLERSLLHIQTL